MKDTQYDIHIRFIVIPEQLVEETLIPQRALYHAKAVRGPFLKSKDAGEFLQKAWHSPTVLEWLTPAGEPLEMMPSKDALLELLEVVKEAIERDG